MPNAKARYTRYMAIPEEIISNAIINHLANLPYRLLFFNSAIVERIMATHPKSMGADTRIDKYLSFPLNIMRHPFHDQARFI